MTSVIHNGRWILVRVKISVKRVMRVGMLSGVLLSGMISTAYF